MRALLRVAAAALSGLLLVLALPPVGWWPLAWIALVPMMMASRGQRFIVGFGLGLLTGVTVAAVTLSGIFFTDRSWQGVPTWVKLGCVIFGATLGVVSAFLAEVKLGDVRRLLGLAAFAVLFEAATLRVLPVTIALTQADVAGMRMVASLVGIWGVAFLLWSANLFLSEILLAKHSLTRLALPAAGLGALLLLGPIWSSAASAKDKGTIVLVQADGDQPSAKLAAMSGHDPSALAIWPEFGGLESAPGGNAQKLKDFSNRPDRPAFVTSFRDGYTPLPHNVAALFSRGQESPRYAKRLLFGGEKQMHSEGMEAVAVPWNGVRVGLNICFDSCSPGVIRETALPDDVRLVALPTIDPPSPHHWIAAMHAAFTPFRAAEAGVPVARADGYAYSMVVDASGQVVRKLAPGEKAEAVSVPLVRRWTLFRQIGNVFLWLCGVLVVAALVPERRRKAATPESVLTEPLRPESARTPEESLSRG
jgi:apolipoprotein N-acyltransferase